MPVGIPLAELKRVNHVGIVRSQTVSPFSPELLDSSLPKSKPIKEKTSKICGLCPEKPLGLCGTVYTQMSKGILKN